MSIPGDSLSSSPGGSTGQEGSILYYKAQYEQLEAELADFQASSRELEAELERDIEASEKRERQLQEKVENLGYEADEWKTKYNQSKMEANAAQNILQKEITTLRDTNRTLQLKLRDIEVVNDDFERQARNTTSSLDDLESKYNVAIERGVMMEEEMKIGEQEREALRIETQRLRDELSDLKVEAEIRSDKLRHAEAVIERQRLRIPAPLNPGLIRPRSPISENSPTTTTASSPTIATPPAKSASSTVSETPTPPSPPTSEPSNSVPPGVSTVSASKSRLSITGSGAAARSSNFSSRPPRHSRGPSIPITNNRSTPSANRRTTLGRQDFSSNTSMTSTSGSLHQIRGLIGKMQKLEQRVNSARSKLPAPTPTPPHSSPRSGSSLGQSYIPPTVTIRSNKKRTNGSDASTSNIKSPLDQRPSSRLSFGIPQPSPSRDTYSSRPASRASTTSRTSTNQLQSTTPSNCGRPGSRLSFSRAQTPLGHYSSNTYASSTLSESRRPRSSVGGSYVATHQSVGHGYSASISRLSNYGSNLQPDGDEESGEALTPTPARRTVYGKEDVESSIPKPGASVKKKLSSVGVGKRISSGPGTRGRDDTEMGPPDRKRLSGVGETF